MGSRLAQQKTSRQSRAMLFLLRGADQTKPPGGEKKKPKKPLNDVAEHRGRRFLPLSDSTGWREAPPGLLQIYGSRGFNAAVTFIPSAAAE